MRYSAIISIICSILSMFAEASIFLRPFAQSLSWFLFFCYIKKTPSQALSYSHRVAIGCIYVILIIFRFLFIHSISPILLSLLLVLSLLNRLIHIYSIHFTTSAVFSFISFGFGLRNVRTKRVHSNNNNARMRFHFL